MFPLVEIPDWYLICREAEALGPGIAPWDLARQGQFWRGVARAMQQVKDRLAEYRRP